MYRKHRWHVKLAAALLSIFLAFSFTLSAMALDEVAATLSAAALLAEQDLDGNMASITVLIQKCVDGLADDDPIRGTLQSVLILLNSGTASSESIALLLHSAIDAQSAAAPDAATPVPEITATPEPEITATPVPEITATPEPEITATPEPEITATPVPEITATPEPEITATPAPATDDFVPPQSSAETETFSESGLPIFEVDSFMKAVMKDRVLVDVPRDWGNNASGRALTSYSPVNGSGAISPSAGTLNISYFPAEGQTEKDAFDAYTKSIAGMSVTTWLSYEDATAAALPARRIDFTMSVGANQFSCETVCFAYEDTVYAIELMQGQQTVFDYFPVYRHVVGSAEVGDDAQVADAIAHQNDPVTTESRPTPEPRTEATPVPNAGTEPPAASPTPTAPPDLPRHNPDDIGRQESVSFSGSIGSFQYMLGGHVYQFPTSIRELAEEDLPLNRDLTIPYDLNSDADMTGGKLWTEIVNTQYYYFENSLYKEMAGVTNMSGYPVAARDCMLTALIDTAGDYLDIVLPGDVRVGGRESDILRGFPAFQGMALDGYARFVGNELLYACNVRDDGCDGYVLIRNDDPYYSAVSIICENGVIREISFECLGSVRADGVFLDE